MTDSHGAPLVTALFFLFALTACAGPSLPTATPHRPEAHREGHFTAKIQTAGQDIPLQGAYRLEQDGGGRFLFFLPSGAVAGSCTVLPASLQCRSSNAQLTKALSAIASAIQQHLAASPTGEAVSFSEKTLSITLLPPEIL